MNYDRHRGKRVSGTKRSRTGAAAARVENENRRDIGFGSGDNVCIGIRSERVLGNYSCLVPPPKRIRPVLSARACSAFRAISTHVVENNRLFGYVLLVLYANRRPSSIRRVTNGRNSYTHDDRTATN